MPDRKPPRLAAGERETLLALQYQRESLVRKVTGAPEPAAREPAVGSGTTLLWLVMTWIEEHGYEHVGPGRDFYLEVNDDDPGRQVFEIQAPLRRPADPVPAVAPRRL